MSLFCLVAARDDSLCFAALGYGWTGEIPIRHEVLLQ